MSRWDEGYFVLEGPGELVHIPAQTVADLDREVDAQRPDLPTMLAVAARNQVRVPAAAGRRRGMTRAYQSALRTKQAERTRDRILAAFAEQLADGGEDFSIPRVAERAGVSVRTVYHHFPNRDAQVEALAAWLDTQMVGDDPGPAGPDDVPEYAARMFRAFVAQESLMRAQLAAGVAEKVRARRKRHRVARLQSAIASLGLSPEDTELVSALFRVLISADLGVALKDRHGVEGDRTVVLIRWTLGTLLEALRRGDTPTAPRRPVGLG